MLLEKPGTWKGRGYVTCLTYRLVAEQDVDIRHDLHQGLFEELADERRREIHAEDFVVFGSVFRHLEDRLRGHRQEESLQKMTRICA